MASTLSDLIAAHRALAAATARAAQAAAAPDADPRAAAKAQHQATLDQLQARVQILADARTRALAEMDAEIAQYQQRIGEVQQLLKEDDSAPPASPDAKGGPTPSDVPKPDPSKPDRSPGR